MPAAEAGAARGSKRQRGSRCGEDEGGGSEGSGTGGGKSGGNGSDGD